MNEQSTSLNPDSGWKGFYTAGGISALLYVFLSLVVSTTMVFLMKYDFGMDARELLEFIVAHKVWWLWLQTLVLGTSILAIIAFVAIFLALKHINKSMAALGAVITCTMQVLFMAYYPILLGLSFLGDKYPAAMDKGNLVIAAEALMAQNNAFNPLYESVFAIGILIISLPMLKGVFHKTVAYLGLANAPAAIIALMLWPVLGVGYFWWWIFFVIWFTAVGLKLLQLGKSKST